ncbi:MAG: hypothetical protein ABI589_10625 [Burkholderiales bacterium]
MGEQRGRGTRAPCACARSCLIGAALAIVVDLAASPAQLIPLEEEFEVLAEALFIGALLAIPPRTEP